MARRRAHITLAQEISCSPSQLNHLKIFFADAGRELVASQVDPNFTHLTGGVGAIGRKDVQVFEIPPITPAFADFCKRGRVMHLGLGCSKTSKVFSAYCIYGFTSGHTVKAQAALTDKILQAIIGEMSAQPKGPVMLGRP